MKNLTLCNIAKACNGTYYGASEAKDQIVQSITTDSRKIEEGSLFVAISGARVDGHDFISQVIQKGAMAVLSEKELPDASFPYIKVDSSLEAVKGIAEFYLKGLNIPVVGITGSVGKTSTKEMIASVLAQKYKVLKTQGNFNNELGLPLTVFRLRDEDEVAVLEMGISDFGEMTRLAKIARPNISVITNIGVCHLENLHDRDGILKAKTEVFAYLKENGTVILNGDDDKLSTIEEVQGKKPVFFGIENHEGYYAEKVENLGLKGMQCIIHTPKEAFEAQIQIPGHHMVYNALAATAVGEALGMNIQEIMAGIKACVPINGRNNLIEANGKLVLDDCYNANPVSMRSGIDVLSMATGRKVAILGDMGELGVDEKKLHYEVGEYAAKKELDVLIMVGELCKEMERGARKALQGTEIFYFATKGELLLELDKIVKEGDTVLVKASHFMGFEEVVGRLVAGGTL